VAVLDNDSSLRKRYLGFSDFMVGWIINPTKSDSGSDVGVFAVW